MSLTVTATTSTEERVIWDGLRPRNVVQAAASDIARRARNAERANDQSSPNFGEDYEVYAFLRKHVENADGPFGLIQNALDAVIHDRKHPKPLIQKETYNKRSGETTTKWFDPSLRGRLMRSSKTHMKHLYNEALLIEAMKLEKSNG